MVVLKRARTVFLTFMARICGHVSKSKSINRRKWFFQYHSKLPTMD